MGLISSYLTLLARWRRWCWYRRTHQGRHAGPPAVRRQARATLSSRKRELAKIEALIRRGMGDDGRGRVHQPLCPVRFVLRKMLPGVALSLCPTTATLRARSGAVEVE